MTTTDLPATDPLDVLRRHWGYGQFRQCQREIIDSVLHGHDTLGLLPTGGGKSITFQVPALMLPGLTLVVTPLISLMKDQVDNLADRGIPAVYFHAGQDHTDASLALQKCRLGKIRLAYISPERLSNQRFTSMLRLTRVSLIVVDEAHCISQWGYDFRPSYLQIGTLRQICPEAPVLALTASATPEVAADIMRLLQFKEPRSFARSFARANLSYIVRYCDSKPDMLLHILRQTQGCAIVYVRSRLRTLELAEIIADAGIPAAAYHAGLNAHLKEQRQNLWKNGQIRVIVATNAFGMGIDKPDVRLVVHADLPSSLEEYYQEAGRAGRDGLHSYAVLLASPYDKGVLRRRINASFPPKDFIGEVYEKICDYLGVAVGEGYQRICEFDAETFCQTYRLPMPLTLTAMTILARSGYLEYTDEVATRARAMVVTTKEALYHLQTSPQADEVLRFLLRNYTGLFADYVPINEPDICYSLNISWPQLYDSLQELRRHKAIAYVPARSAPQVCFLTAREEKRHLIIPLAAYEHLRQRMEQRAQAMKQYAFATTGCRVKGMLEYFGETPAPPCGRCDLCRGITPDIIPVPQSDPEARLDLFGSLILELASRPQGCTPDEAAGAASVSIQQIIPALRTLADAGEITFKSGRFHTL